MAYPIYNIFALNFFALFHIPYVKKQHESINIKAACKMLVKLIPAVNFTNIIQPAFCQLSFAKQLQIQNCAYIKVHVKHSSEKAGHKC